MTVPFRGVDFYDLDELLTEEQKAVRTTVRDWVSKRVIPIIEKHNLDATFPKHLIGEMAELGLLGAPLQGYDCAGMDSIAYGLVLQELERGDSGIRSFASVQTSLCMWPIYTYGSEAQKKKYLPDMAHGRKIGCFGLTEPDFGSNPGGMITRAKKKGNKWILNGAKMWITNATIADLAIVWAKDEKDTILGFVVDKDCKGYSTKETLHKFSLRASVTGELIFQDCELPEDALLPGVKGIKGPLSCLTQARYGIAWGAIGSAMACYDASVNYAKTRIQFGKPIGAFQLNQEKLAYMLTEITKGQLLSLRLAQLKNAGKMKPEQVSLAKRNNVEIALNVARIARDLHGANGITSEYPVIRHMMNLESVKTYEGTHDIHTLVLGQAATGIAAYE
ncbi:MAG: acyl-CoA dehydrogenase family protein [Planctomycetes bacterium]|nr:acyl-CoA dehydrogenase family protein [Planctomycetota bacterium]